ncbi:MAG: hypothetical protein L6R38_004266 [Xanthoria sp. 2 TBL-2021]|nr:MAG: hypothetical protein L6R38_004266 [Xanthoria sp. 2 TBL-2021]
MGSPWIFICFFIIILSLIFLLLGGLVIRRALEDIVRLLQDNNRILREENKSPQQTDLPLFPPSLGEGEYTEFSRRTGPSHKHYDTYALNYRGKGDTKNQIPRSLDIDYLSQDVEGPDSTASNPRYTGGGVANVGDPAEANAVHEDVQAAHEGVQARGRKGRKAAKSNVHWRTGLGNDGAGDDDEEDHPSSSKSSSSKRSARAEKRWKGKGREDDSHYNDVGDDEEETHPSSSKSSSSKHSARAEKRRKGKGKGREDDSCYDEVGDDEEENRPSSSKSSSSKSSARARKSHKGNEREYSS